MTSSNNGFSLLELLLALAVGLMLVAVIGEALLGELRQSGRLARILQERAVSKRALELMRMEVQEALAVQVMPGAMTREHCGLAGRTVLLHLEFPPNDDKKDRNVTYSLERNPSSIWRGQVLMRCGPAYGLDGQMGKLGVSSDVWLDALDRSGISLVSAQPETLTLRMQRVFPVPVGEPLEMSSETEFSVPPLQ